MDRVLLVERVMKEEEYLYSTNNSQLLLTLTLYAPMVVPSMDRVLLVERAMGEDAYSTNNCQVPITLTYAPMVVP